MHEILRTYQRPKGASEMVHHLKGLLNAIPETYTVEEETDSPKLSSGFFRYAMTCRLFF